MENAEKDGWPDVGSSVLQMTKEMSKAHDSITRMPKEHDHVSNKHKEGRHQGKRKAPPPTPEERKVIS